jgi:phosphoglucosamine mutase
MTPEIALRVGMAVGIHFGREGRVVVGKDTRLSGYMFETALSAGLCAVGADVMLVGPLPTPGIAYITRSMRADAGVVISASHNPYGDNGIKLFAADGFKLPDSVERHLEELIEGDEISGQLATGASIGKAVRIDDAAGRYITHLKHALAAEFRLDGLRIVIDCAHGAAYRIAPAVLAELGAEVVTLGVDPNGTNINANVGATAPEAMAKLVAETRADLGIALDGDADRAVFCDAAGELVDGDEVLAILGRELAEVGTLKGQTVVATVMSNMGLERSLAEVGVALIRTPVGDRYVVEAMRREGANLGGEQSGHTVFLDHGTTGDGMVAALQLLSVLIRTGRPLHELKRVMQRYPQVARSFAVAKKVPLEELPRLRGAIADVESELGTDGRVVVRYSGTESKLRVMVEGVDDEVVAGAVRRIGETAMDELAGE